MTETRMIKGSPHLRHESLRRLYEALIDRAVLVCGRPPVDLSVLELGAGDGLASTPWLRRGARLTAVDSSGRMLARLQQRALTYGKTVSVVEADAASFLDDTRESFDIICFVSMLHHVPDYRALIRRAITHIRPGGSALTFQDPLRYDTLPRPTYFAFKSAYFAWRITQGNLKQGFKTRIRRLRGFYSPDEAVDFDEYHVVRNGVDAEAIAREFELQFKTVRVERYWSTHAKLLQAAGDALRLRTNFGILAEGRL